MMRALIFGAVAAAAMWAMPGPGAIARADDALSAEEQRWLDRRLSEDERAILNATVGFAPPEFPDDVRWIDAEPLTLEGLRGKVVVIQTWTRRSVIGRAAPSRVEHLLSRFSSDDVQVIALHTPEGADGVEGYLERRPSALPVAIDPSGAFCDELGAYDRPLAIVLDRQGAVRYSGVGIAGLPQAVDKLVAAEFDASVTPECVPSRDQRDEALGFGSNDGASTPKTRTSGAFPAIRGRLSNGVDLRGRKGPALFASNWITDKPDADGKVVVAEFWATWCGPCVRGIPHLNELQAAFPDSVVVAGISDEPVQKIKAMLPRLNMKYSVGTDPTRRMRQMIQNRGIPHAIVMSPDGIVRWQGHPMHLTEEILGQVVSASGVGTGAASGGASRLRWTGAEG